MAKRSNRLRQSERPEKPRFSSTDHLSAEAVAAYVDNELGRAARRRAMDHVAQCEECHEEIAAQRGAAERVRGCSNDGVRAPDFLVERLSRLSEEDGAAATEDNSGTGARFGVFSRVEQALRERKSRGPRTR